MPNFLSDYLDYAINLALINGGWLLFLAGLIWMLYRLRLLANQKLWMAEVKWVFLEVRIEELSERSPIAMEQIFAALHAIHTNYTWGERLNGKQILSVSCEIVSLGGNVSYIFKVPERYRNLLESAVFAQYPKAEIYEIEDYMKNMPEEYFPETAEFDFWGTQLNKQFHNGYVIRTYGAFEHPEQKTFVDPLANVIEVMSNIEPHELMIAQIIIRPEALDWKKNVKPLLDKLKGAPKGRDLPFWHRTLYAIPHLIAEILVTHILAVPKDEHIRLPKEEPPSQMLHKTEGEKQVIAAIEHGLTKVAFICKVRLLYLAPKDKFNKSLRVPEIIGAFRNFGDDLMNNLKPDLRETWTEKPYWISETLEKNFRQWQTLTRKRHMWHAFMLRSWWRGSGYTILNTEELASIYHFPVAPNVRVSQVERVTAAKSAPPIDLPIAK